MLMGCQIREECVVTDKTQSRIERGSQKCVFNPKGEQLPEWNSVDVWKHKWREVMLYKSKT